MRGYGLSIHMGSLSGELVFTVQLNSDLTINHFISLFLLTMLMQPPACSASSSLHSSHLSPTHYRIAFQHILPWYRERKVCSFIMLEPGIVSRFLPRFLPFQGLINTKGLNKYILLIEVLQQKSSSSLEQIATQKKKFST